MAVIYQQQEGSSISGNMEETGFAEKTQNTEAPKEERMLKDRSVSSIALARWRSWLQCHPVHEKVVGWTLVRARMGST